MDSDIKVFNLSRLLLDDVLNLLVVAWEDLASVGGEEAGEAQVVEEVVGEVDRAAEAAVEDLVVEAAEAEEVGQAAGDQVAEVEVGAVVEEEGANRKQKNQLDD